VVRRVFGNKREESVERRRLFGVLTRWGDVLLMICAADEWRVGLLLDVGQDGTLCLWGGVFVDMRWLNLHSACEKSILFILIGLRCGLGSVQSISYWQV
jgi:hypothetical protein